MRKFVFILFLGMLTCSLAAQDQGFGAGVIIGEPTGISLKTWVSANDALDAGVAWSISHGWFHVHADYMRHAFALIPVEKGQLPLYFGGGVKVGFGTDIFLGLRVPVGLDYMFESVPLDVFLEVVPGLGILPDTKFDTGGGIGVRYWF